MKEDLKYILQGFGFETIKDFNTTCFKAFYLADMKLFIITSISLGTIREFIVLNTGLDIVFWGAFIFLIIAEWQTGLRVALKSGDKFRSRKFGRMILKIGVYVAILWMLHSFSKATKIMVFDGFELNPFAWLYYVVVVAITFQMFISWLENLGNLGYNEAKNIAGIVLRKFNKWFEFEGQKNGDNFEFNNNKKLGNE
jgi:hypothetical protein